MSTRDSKDDVTGRILPPAGSDDSKESKPSKKEDKKDDGIDWETNEIEDADELW